MAERAERTVDTAQDFKRAVESFLRQHNGFTISRLPELIEHVRFVVSNPACLHITQDEVAVLAAMCALGPEIADSPPAAMRDELLQLRQRYGPGRFPEVVIAYGCGKWRTVKPGCIGWSQRWQGAMRELVRVLERSGVRETDEWLRNGASVVGFPARSKADLCQDAWVLATRIVHPENPLHLEQNESLRICCTDEGTELNLSRKAYEMTVPSGAKAVFTLEECVLQAPRTALPLTAGTRVIALAREDTTRIEADLQGTRKWTGLELWQTACITGPASLVIWECACGNMHCAERHRLDGWDPEKVELWDFMVSAVKGPQPNIQTGSFVQGMYAALLAQEGT